MIRQSYVHRAVAARNIDELRSLAQRRLPRGFFEYIDRGAEDERALVRNREVFDRLAFTPRCLIDTSSRTTRTAIFGRDSSAPLVIAPTAAAGLLWYDGETHLARAAKEAGIPATLSTASISALEDVVQQAGGDLWFQLYIYPDLDLTYQLVDRVGRAGYTTLVVTLDTTVGPNREYNARNGFHVPFRFSGRALADASLHPHWATTVVLRHLLSRGIPAFANLPDQLKSDLRGKKRATNLMPKNEACGWELVAKLRERWKGTLVLKGVLHPDDARLALDHGVDGIVVSNHGGRNLDAVVSPLEVLPAIANVVDGRLTILADSGIRRGADVAKAIALGADAVLLGRAALWGVATGGQQGAARAIDIVQSELSRVMAQIGVSTLTQLKHSRLLDKQTSFATRQPRSTTVD